MKLKTVFISLFILIVLIIIYLGMPTIWSFYQAIFNPSGRIEINKQYQSLPSSELIKKLTPLHPFGSTSIYAMEVLAERRDTSAVPAIIKLLDSVNPNNRYQAIRALGNIGDIRAKQSLHEIINKGESKNNPNYEAALYSLCQIGDDSVLPLVLRRLERSDAINNGSINMLKYIGRLQDIEALKKMKIDDDSKGRLTRDLTNEAIDDAIWNIRNRNIQ